MAKQLHEINAKNNPAKNNPAIYQAFKNQYQYDNQEIVCLEYSDIEVYVAYCPFDFSYYIITIDVNTNYGYNPNVNVIKL